jgi:hypothetical protein
MLGFPARTVWFHAVRAPALDAVCSCVSLSYRCMRIRVSGAACVLSKPQRVPRTARIRVPRRADAGCPSQQACPPSAHYYHYCYYYYHYYYYLCCLLGRAPQCARALRKPPAARASHAHGIWPWAYEAMGQRHGMVPYALGHGMVPYAHSHGMVPYALGHGMVPYAHGHGMASDTHGASHAHKRHLEPCYVCALEPSSRHGDVAIRMLRLQVQKPLRAVQYILSSQIPNTESLGCVIINVRAIPGRITVPVFCIPPSRGWERTPLVRPPLTRIGSSPACIFSHHAHRLAVAAGDESFAGLADPPDLSKRRIPLCRRR